MSSYNFQEIFCAFYYFKFNGKQLLGTATGTKFAPTYASIFMHKLKSGFLKSQELTPLLCYSDIDDGFLYLDSGWRKTCIIFKYS